MKNFDQLVEITFPLDKGFCAHHFGKDTAYAPHVDGGTVALFAEEEFGGTVPACDDAVCVLSFRTF